MMHAAGQGQGHGHGLGPRHSDSGAGHYLSAPHMLLPPRSRSQQHGEAGGSGGGVGGYGGAAGSTTAGMAGVPSVSRGGATGGRSGVRQQQAGKQQRADEDMEIVEDDVVEVRQYDNCVRNWGTRQAACMGRRRS